MSDDTNFNHNVKGKDGVKPSWNPEGVWMIRAKHQLYMGQNGGAQVGDKIVPLYVGNVNDYVEDTTTHSTEQIVALNLDTLIPTLEPITRNANDLSRKDILTARGPGLGAADHKITIDTTVFPHRLDVSPFMEIKSVEAQYAKIIKGSPMGDHRVVGFMMTPSGSLVDDKIPLDLLQDVAGVVNYQVRNVHVCYTNEEIKDGDVLTVALYSSAGHFLNSTQLVVNNSNFMHDGTAPRDYIEKIYLDSPYLSNSNPFEIQLPLNWNNAALNMVGVVQYQSGRKIQLPIDGRKFVLEGIQQHLSSITGQKYNMILKYLLDPGENTVTNLGGFSNHIPQKYSVVTVAVKNSYTVKLYAFPNWDAVSNSYRLRYFMVNLDRTFVKEVTSSVKPVAGTPVFNGFAFATTQRIQVSLNLRDVVNTFKPFVHTQVMDITLYGVPGEYRAPWTVRQTSADSDVIGKKMFALKSYTGSTVNLKGECTTQEEWLETYFKKSFPLLADPNNPSSHPTPTHFDVRIGNDYTEFPISDWDKDLTVNGTLVTHSNLDVIWKYKSVTEELVISITSMFIQLPA